LSAMLWVTPIEKQDLVKRIFTRPHLNFSIQDTKPLDPGHQTLLVAGFFSCYFYTIHEVQPRALIF
jgi:hypothetical protein